MTVPFTFGTATTSIPLSNLDSNFNTPITLGNTSIYLGNTTTTIGNLTLTNVTISSGTANITSNITYATANAVVFTNSSSIGTTGANLTFDGTTFTASSIKNSALTSGQVTFAGASGLLSDSSTLTYDGTSLTTPRLVLGGTTLPSAGTATLFSRTSDNNTYLQTGSGNNFNLLDGSQNTMISFAPTLLSFAISNSEKMRIDSSGNLLVGGTTTSTGFAVIKGVNYGESYISMNHPTSTPSGYGYADFLYNSNLIGNITQNGTTGVLYNLTSDYRLKNNPTALTGASDFIMALQPKTWDWHDGSGKGVGFIAHEFMEVAKYSGNGTKDEVDEKGKPKYQSIQPSSSEVMANLISLVQEQQALIESLTTRLTALESK